MYALSTLTNQADVLKNGQKSTLTSQLENDLSSSYMNFGMSHTVCVTNFIELMDFKRIKLRIRPRNSNILLNFALRRQR